MKRHSPNCAAQIRLQRNRNEIGRRVWAKFVSKSLLHAFYLDFAAAVALAIVVVAADVAAAVAAVVPAAEAVAAAAACSSPYCCFYCFSLLSNVSARPPRTPSECII